MERSEEERREEEWSEEGAWRSDGAAEFLRGSSCVPCAVAVMWTGCQLPATALNCVFALALLFAAMFAVLEYILHLLSHFLLPPR